MIILVWEAIRDQHGFLVSFYMPTLSRTIHQYRVYVIVMEKTTDPIVNPSHRPWSFFFFFFLQIVFGFPPASRFRLIPDRNLALASVRVRMRSVKWAFPFRNSTPSPVIQTPITLVAFVEPWQLRSCISLLTDSLLSMTLLRVVKKFSVHALYHSPCQWQYNLYVTPPLALSRNGFNDHIYAVSKKVVVREMMGVKKKKTKKKTQQNIRLFTAKWS